MDLSLLHLQKQRITSLNKKNIYSVEDLLRFLPRKYYDYSHPKKVDELIEGEMVSIIGCITKVEKKVNYIKVSVIDESGQFFSCMWFNVKSYFTKFFEVGSTYIFCGKVSCFEPYPGKIYKSLISPTFSKDIEKHKVITPVYSKVQGIKDESLKEIIWNALVFGSKSEYLELDVLKKYNLLKSYEMERILHYPTSFEAIEKAKERLVFDELFKYGLVMSERSFRNHLQSNLVISKKELADQFVASLPFKLTVDQENVVCTIFEKMKNGEKINALVQGDVGCGKTMVAILLMLILVDNGYQACMMAPTNVLAAQHYQEACKMAENLPGVKPAFLSGELTAKKRKEILNQIKAGDVNLIIGTHALVSSSVQFCNLGLAIIDEEHRFGVEQRELFERRNKGIHQVTMSATPIPRSLALTIYGENIDIFTIKTLPNGRKPVKTSAPTNEFESYEFMLKEIQEGRQCYIVCPLIEDSDSDRLKEVDSVEKTYEKVTQYFKKNKEVKVGKITGKMKKNEVDEELLKFANLDYNIIISTTIIEVGVNVPNSTVILIKNAERFGIAQLHQLRGRVGRGNHQSYCLLLTEKKDDPRIETLIETTDGFKIAEKDIELRGVGDFIGTKQTGENKAVMLMIANPDLYKTIKEETDLIVRDPIRRKKYLRYIEQED